MVQLVCHCLNVGIHCKHVQSHENSADETDPFFENASEVTLTLAGITIEHECLCCTRVVGHWLVNQCAVCATDTHAWRVTHALKTILVNAKLERNASELRQSPYYSPVFCIVLRPKDDNLSPLITKKAFESERHTLQQRVHRYLNDEQRLMEERIRTFTEQEHSRFAEMQIRIGRDEELLLEVMNTIRANTDTKDVAKSNQQIDDEKPIDNAENLKPKDVPFRALIHKKNAFGLKSFPRRVTGGRLRSQSLINDFGGVFEFDGDDYDDGEVHAFDSISYSDDEEDDESLTITAVSDNERIEGMSSQISHNERHYHNHNHHDAANVPMMAFSLPITVPQWEKHRSIGEDDDNVCDKLNRLEISNAFSQIRYDDDDDEDDDDEDHDKDLAKRMAKLAKSVRNESDDIFGDKPRRRLNTGDLIKSRPI